MWQEIGKLFTTNQLIPVIFIVIGLVFCVIEIFKFKFSSFGIIGGVLIIASLLAVLMLKGTVAQFVFLIIIVFVVIIVAFCIMTIVTENAVFFKKSKKKLEETEEVNHEEQEKKTLSKLVGKVGVAVTDINLEGKILVNGVTLDATSENESIDKNSNIKIVKIDGIKIFVNKIEE